MRMKKLAVMALATALSVGSVMTASAAWLQEGSNWRYQNDNGTFQTGTWFRDADGRWYHFDNNGIMQKGWFQDADGKWYFLAYNGVMQVGLIKVDNQVYYMGTSGDLFIGDMKIGNTTYNFGLYGTTNGQPSVPASATYGGNGNQSLNGGGGSSSNTEKDPSPTVSQEVEKAIKAVSDKAKSIETNYDTVKSVNVTSKGNAVAVKVVAADLDFDKKPEQVEELTEAIQEAFTAALTNADESKAEVFYENMPSHTINSGDDISKYINRTNLDKYMNKTVTVKIKVGGEDVVYTIQLN